MVTIFNEYLPLLSMALGAIVWFLRLEAKVDVQEKEIKVLSQIMLKLSEISERLSYIEGSLTSKPHHGKE